MKSRRFFLLLFFVVNIAALQAMSPKMLPKSLFDVKKTQEGEKSVGESQQIIKRERTDETDLLTDESGDETVLNQKGESVMIEDREAFEPSSINSTNFEKLLLEAKEEKVLLIEKLEKQLQLIQELEKAKNQAVLEKKDATLFSKAVALAEQSADEIRYAMNALQKIAEITENSSIEKERVNIVVFYKEVAKQRNIVADLDNEASHLFSNHNMSDAFSVMDEASPIIDDTRSLERYVIALIAALEKVASVTKDENLPQEEREKIIMLSRKAAKKWKTAALFNFKKLNQGDALKANEFTQIVPWLEVSAIELNRTIETLEKAASVENSKDLFLKEHREKIASDWRKLADHRETLNNLYDSVIEKIKTDLQRKNFDQVNNYIDSSRDRLLRAAEVLDKLTKIASSQDLFPEQQIQIIASWTKVFEQYQIATENLAKAAEAQLLDQDAKAKNFKTNGDNAGESAYQLKTQAITLEQKATKKITESQPSQNLQGQKHFNKPSSETVPKMEKEGANPFFKKLNTASTIAYQAQEKAEEAERKSDNEASLFYWEEAVKKAIAVYREAEVVEKAYTKQISQKLTKEEEDLHNFKIYWNAMTAWYKAKERTTAAHLAQQSKRSIQNFSENNILRSSLMRCTQEAAEGWKQVFEEFTRNEKIISKQLESIGKKLPLQECQEMEVHWKKVADDIQAEYKDFLEARKKAENEQQTACAAKTSSSFNNIPIFEDLWPLNAVSEDEKTRFLATRFLEGKDIPLENGKQRKRVRILRTSTTYPYLRTEEIFNDKNEVLSRSRMAADELVIEPGINFNLATFSKEMEPEVSSIDERIIFEKPLYILKLREHSIEAFETAQQKIKTIFFDSGKVKFIEPSFFLTFSGNQNARQNLQSARLVPQTIIPANQPLSVNQSLSVNQPEDELDLKTIMDRDHGWTDNIRFRQGARIVAISDTGFTKEHPFFNQGNALRISGFYFSVGAAVRIMESHLKSCMMGVIKKLPPANEELFIQLYDSDRDQERKIEKQNFIAEFTAVRFLEKVKSLLKEHIKRIVESFNEAFGKSESLLNQMLDFLTESRTQLAQEHYPDCASALLDSFEPEFLNHIRGELQGLFMRQHVFNVTLSQESVKNFLPDNLFNILTKLIADLIYHKDSDTIIQSLEPHYPALIDPELDQELLNNWSHDPIGDYLTKDREGHGTSSTGVLARFTKNAAPLFICKHTDETIGTAPEIAECIEQAYKKGASILNCSFDIFETHNHPNSLIIDILKIVGQPGKNGEKPMAVVIAAGNSGRDLSNHGENIFSNTELQHVLFVAGTNATDNNLLDRHAIEELSVNKIASSYGKTIVRVAARGENVLTTSSTRFFRGDNSPLYHRKHGTSLSTPHVTAALHVAKQEFFSFTNAKELIDIFLNDARFIGQRPNLSNKIENGRILKLGDMQESTGPPSQLDFADSR